MKWTADLRRMLIAVIITTLYFTLYKRRQTVVPTSQSSATENSFIIATTTASIHEFTNSTSFHYGRIAFRLHPPYDIDANPSGKFDPVPSHSCRNAAHLPPSMANSLLGFRVSISTNLNIISVGDSVASQLSQAFDASVLDVGYDYRKSIRRYFDNGDGIKRMCVTESTARGGGVAAYMRHNFMVSYDSMRERGECKHGGKFWGVNDARSLLDSPIVVDGKRTSRKVGKFDAAILKLPVIGWIRNIHSITRENIIEEIKIVGEYFGVETVILSTITFNNNVKTMDDWKGIHEVNAIMREIANNWIASENPVRWVLVQDLYNLTNQMIWTNAMHLGYNVTLDFSVPNWDQGENINFLFDRFERTSRYNWPASIPMVCDQKTLINNGTDCLRNKLSPDGMHWCTDTIGPRYSASNACLLGCVYNGKYSYLVEIEAVLRGASVRACEEECNRRFMSLVPVDEKWISDGAILYSRV